MVCSKGKSRPGVGEIGPPVGGGAVDLSFAAADLADLERVRGRQVVAVRHLSRAGTVGAAGHAQLRLTVAVDTVMQVHMYMLPSLFPFGAQGLLRLAKLVFQLVDLA